MFYHNLNPVLLKIGFLEIRYYGLVYVFSFIFFYFLMRYLIKKKEIGVSKKSVEDLVFYSMVGVIFGARLFYFIFYNFVNLSFLEFFRVWHGGMSYHGGLIGAVISVLIFCKVKKINFYDLADIIVIPLGLFLFFGRLANFINGELYGRVTDVFWAVKFKGVEGFRHPSQIYEAFKNLFIFGVLWNLKDKKLPRGFLFWLYIFLFGILRFFIEFFRAPDPQVGFIWFLTMGQILCVFMVLVGGVMLVKLKNENREFKIKK